MRNELLNLGRENPKRFWEIIGKMTKWGKEKMDETDRIKPEIWREYFESLLNNPSSTEGGVKNFLPTFDHVLDRRITIE